MDILVHDSRVGRANDRCNFMISNRSAVFEVASAENSGTTDNGVSDAGRSIPSFLCTFRPYLASAGSLRSKAHSASFEV
jgi:hypothetical protein